MSRESRPNDSENKTRWEHFINPTSKAASPLFDELCRGLASVIRRLEPSHDTDLSPERLANFYRTCGANFDELFRNTGEHGVSFLYRTLGCYHSLQPSSNAFESPSIPCLNDDGYVRWQTLQMLLCPDEHTAVIQRAVEIYDVPRKRDGSFPKTIPRECFPARPDVDMEKWHRFITSQMNQENYMRRLNFSPYQSPQPDATSSPGGYFARVAAIKRQSTSYSRKREAFSEEELARSEAAQEAARRRSSVPDLASPGGTLYNDKKAAHAARSRSAVRPVSDSKTHIRQRPYTGSQAPQFPPPGHGPTQRFGSPSYGSSSSVDRSARRDHRDDRDRSSGSRPATASDVSSDAEDHRRKPRSFGGEDDVKRRSPWGSSLIPSFFLSNNKRRHSSDGHVPTLKDERRSPRRGDSIRKYKTEGPENSPPVRHVDFPPPDRVANGVRFNKVFNAPDTPQRPEQTQPAPPPTSYRYSEPQANVYPPPHGPHQRPPSLNYIPPTPPNVPEIPITNPTQHFEARKQGLPTRVATFSGVNGRRYAPPGSRNAIDPVMTTRRDRSTSFKHPPTSTVI